MIQFLYDIIYTVPVCLAVISVFFPYLGMGRIFSYILSAVFGVTFVLFYHLKTRGRILLVGTCAAFAAGLFFVHRTETLSVNPKMIVVALISMGCFIIAKTADHYIRLKAALAGTALILLVFFMVNGIKPEKPAAVSVLFYILISLSEIIQIFWKKEGDTNVRKHVVCVFPFILSVMLIPMIARFPEKPYDWKFFKDIAGSIRNGYEIVISAVFSDKGWDGGDIMGFSDRGVIGGRVQGSPYKALTVSTDSYNDYRLYLFGRSFDTFNGKGWEKTDDSAVDYNGFDLIETYAAVKKKYPDNVSGLLRKVRMHIIYEGVRTKYAFVPEKSVMPAVQLTENGGDLCFPSSKRADYFTDYYRQNRDSGEYLRMLSEAEPLSEEDWQQAVSAFGDAFEKGYSYNDYLKYKEKIREIYRKDVVLSERTAELLESILEGAESDHEKLKRIEKYLSGLTYTRQPGELPENVSSAADFTDYLLFEKKEGFCTHFATAFVLLARSQGIPARYIQGYSTLSSSTRFEVMTDRAHAWPEAYIEGIGWVSFEPTPGFIQERGWGSTKIQSESVHTVYNGHPEYDTEMLPDEQLPEDGSAGMEVLSMVGRRIILSLVFLSVFLILYVLSDIAVKKYRYGKMNDRDKIFTVCRRNLRLLKRTGLARMDGETLTEFSKRACKEVPSDILSFIGIYEKLLYSKYEESPGDLYHAEECEKACSRFVRAYYAKRIKRILIRE